MVEVRSRRRQSVRRHSPITAPGGTCQNAVFLLYNYLRRPGGTGILPVACRTGFTHLNGGFL